jgi:hypothetical protein
MATQVMGARRRLQIGAALVALAFAAAVLVLAIQAGSIWSTSTAVSSQVPAAVVPSEPVQAVCLVGCGHSGTSRGKVGSAPLSSKPRLHPRTKWGKVGSAPLSSKPRLHPRTKWGP